MDLITMLFIALGLAMDAFAVSITGGIMLRCSRTEGGLRAGILFGAFQMIMPFIGWLAAFRFSKYISAFDHWIAFALLSIIGIKMIREAFSDEEIKCDLLNIKNLIILAIATSIDALAVGVSFAFLDISIVTPILIIGGVAFMMSFAGVFIGNRFGHLFEKKIEIAGGAILIIMGLKILAEHTIFS